MSRIRSIVGKLWPRSNVKKVIILLIIIFVSCSGGFIVVSEQTSFCNSCHIMNPYYASWQSSGHSEVNCLECHVQPGFAGIVRAKLNGLAQAVDCFLDRVSPKPSAMVEDASCLREDCHSKESLLAEPVTDVENKYKFSHQGHIDANVSGLPLLCTTCHSHFEGQEHFKVSTQVCYICHFSKDDKNSTVHSVDTRCRDCHNVPSESIKRDQAEIDHSKFIAAQLGCEQLCHNKQIDPNTHVSDVRCLDCHEFRNQGKYDAKYLHVKHSGKHKVECLACHEMMNHGVRPIEKRHTSLKCDQCHQVPFEVTRLIEIEFIKLPGDCSLCHKEPHNGQFQKTCRQCHSEHGWTGRWVADAHGQDASFPLVGKHRTVECGRCHMGAKLAQARFVGLPRTCEQCHTSPHGNQFDRNCDECHTERGWKDQWKKVFHTADSEFPLKGKHVTLTCDKCHVPAKDDFRLASAKFAGLDTKCQSCHNDPHNAQMSHSCSTCHSEPGWKGKNLLFSHNEHSVFKLDTLHGQFSCNTCHPKTQQGTRYRPLDKHCELCHQSQTLAMQGMIAPEQKVFEPDPHWGRVVCINCHNTNTTHQSAENYADHCVSCHNSHYGKLFYDWSKVFHDYSSETSGILEDDTIEQLKGVGLHNIQMSELLWNEAIKKSIK